MLEEHEHYEGREQTWVKHFVLRKYLERFGHIIGSRWSSISYIDGFSGPWKSQSDDASDTSFSIALKELRKARDTHAGRKRTVQLRCLFLEKDKTRFAVLKSFANQVDDVEILLINSNFEDAIPKVIEFLDQDPGSFPFVFIDPTGWTGFSMELIAPLLKRQPCEVLINFMLEFVRRFIEHEFSRESFLRLFGSGDFDAGLKDFRGLDRDDAIADRYCRSLREICGFDYVQRAIVLHPDRDQTHFLLIYGTRHPSGVKAFKDVEKSAMSGQEKSRARVESTRKSTREGGQLSLLPTDDVPDSRYFTELRDRYLAQARLLVVDKVNHLDIVTYDALWSIALSLPLVWKQDVDGWLREWCSEGSLQWQGHGSSERTFKPRKNHRFARKVSEVS